MIAEPGKTGIYANTKRPLKKMSFRKSDTAMVRRGFQIPYSNI